MQVDTRIKILRSIGRVYELSNKCQVIESFSGEIALELQNISCYFKTTVHQSFFIALIFSLNYRGRNVELSELVDYLDCNPMKMLEYGHDIKALREKGIICRTNSMHRRSSPTNNDQYYINNKIVEAILDNRPLPDLNNHQYKDTIDLLEDVYMMCEQRLDDEITAKDLLDGVVEIIQLQYQFPLMNRIKEMCLGVPESILFLYLVWLTLSGKETINLENVSKLTSSTPSEGMRYVQSILGSKNALIRKNLIEIENSMFLNEAELKLSSDSLDILNECGFKFIVKNRKCDNIIDPSGIQPKLLIYNEEEGKQLRLLENLLIDSKFKETQKKLSEKNMPRGVTVLFFGHPGTGKTETALQLARDTNRQVMKVDISNSKSKWYGDSEKIIKRIFTDYKHFSEECKLRPILLFNEADGIMSKRRSFGSSSVDQTENTIQNIILEELESFEGILIATTNLTQNLDAAFERRFLFKIEFQKPEISAKAKIWKLKIPELSVTDCFSLASRFDFSGGQIDNIARKFEISNIINELPCGLSNIIGFCEEELIEKKRIRIGFK